MSARPPTRPHHANAVRALALTTLAAIVVVGAATATPWRLAVPEIVGGDAQAPPMPQAPPPSSGPVTPDEPADTTALTVVVVALTVLGAVIIATLLVLLARRLLANRPPVVDPDRTAPGDATGQGPLAPATPLAELQDAVHRALAHVDAATTPHDAVVAAWVALEDTAATHGTTRRPAQTPTEFTGQLLAGTPAPARDVTTLRTLYAEARFTDRPVRPDQVTRARDALQHIAHALDTDADTRNDDSTP